MPAAADSDGAVVLPCIFQDSHDILSVLDERDGFGAAFCIDGPTSYGLGVTRMIRSDPIASERLGWTRHGSQRPEGYWSRVSASVGQRALIKRG